MHSTEVLCGHFIHIPKQDCTLPWFEKLFRFITSLKHLDCSSCGVIRCSCGFVQWEEEREWVCHRHLRPVSAM